MKTTRITIYDGKASSQFDEIEYDEGIDGGDAPKREQINENHLR